MTDVEALYVQQIRSLPAEARLQLLALIAQGLAGTEYRGQRRITELQGLGKEIWAGMDAQEYVDQLRNEWDARP
jgi:hypothetical protein